MDTNVVLAGSAFPFTGSATILGIVHLGLMRLCSTAISGHAQLDNSDVAQVSLNYEILKLVEVGKKLCFMIKNLESKIDICPPPPKKKTTIGY